MSTSSLRVNEVRFPDGSNTVHAYDVKAPEYGAKGDGTTDDTTAIQAAFNAVPATGGTVFFPNGTYKITSTITIAPHIKIVGASRGASSVTQATNGIYAFQYLSALSGNRDIDMGGSVEDITINSQYGVQLNQSGNYASVFSQQANIKGFVFRRVTMTGTYSNADPNYDTSAALTETAAEAFGIGISIAKAFDFRIQDCLIQKFGVALRFDGSDINVIDNNRFNDNARVWYSLHHDLYGSQNTFRHNDVLTGHRVGWVFLDGSFFHTIEDNYFEAYTPAATYIQTSNDYQTNIIGNRFDDTQQSTTPAFVFAPLAGLNVFGNRWNPSSPTPPITFSSTNFSASYPVFAQWKNNDVFMPVPDYPGVIVDRFEPYVLRYNNYNNSGGIVGASFPWITSGTTGRWVLNTATTSFIYNMTQQDRSHRRFQVSVTGRNIGAGGFVVVRYIENSITYTLWSATAGLTNTTSTQTVKFTVALPDAVIGIGSFTDSKLQVELVTNDGEFESVVLTPIDFEQASAAPTANSYQLGTRVYNSSPTQVSTEGWICTTAGTASNTAWVALTSYPTVGARVFNGTNVYQVTVAGTSGNTGGPSGTGSAIVDGSVTWKYVNPLAVFQTFGGVGGASSTPWIAPSFLNSWVNFGAGGTTAGYYKDSNGIVHLRGLIKSGTMNNTAFQLPVGYRPTTTLHIVTVANDLFGEIHIDSSGNIQPWVGGNTWQSLDGISFGAEQ